MLGLHLVFVRACRVVCSLSFLHFVLLWTPWADDTAPFRFHVSYVFTLFFVFGGSISFGGDRFWLFYSLSPIGEMRLRLPF